MLKRLWNWIWDIDETRKEEVVKRSVSGEPLLIFKRGLYNNWGLIQTNNGLHGAMISVRITQIGDNVEVIKSLLRREYDDYLSQESYGKLIEEIKRRLAKGGYYYDSKRNSQGTLDIITVRWSEEDKQEILALLNEWNDC